MRPGRLRYFLVIILYLGFGYFLYSNTLNVPFLYDDIEVIVKDEAIQIDSVTWKGLKGIILSDERPVALISFAFNYLFGGLDPYGYHVFNITVHILTAIGFFLFIEGTLLLSPSPRLRDKSFLISGLAGLLWLANPLQTQAVTYIVQRMASMGAMFYVWSLFFYMKGRVSPSKVRMFFFMAFALLSGILAFGTKQNTVTLPIFILLYEVVIIRRGDFSFLLKGRTLVLLLTGMMMFFGFLWIYIPSLSVEPGGWLVYWGKVRFLTGFRIIVYHITQLLLPIPSRLSFQHDFQVSRTLFDPATTLFSLTIVIGLVAYAVVSFRRYPLFSYFTLWFFGNLALETFNLNLIFGFEHRLYLPSMAFFVVGAIAANNLLDLTKRAMQRRVFIAFLLLAIVLSSVNTYVRNNTWRDEYSLWSDVVKKNPNLNTGYIGLGAAYAKDKNYEQALSNYSKANSINPRSPVVRYSMGVMYFALKEYEKAIGEFNVVGSMGFVDVGSGPTISYYFSRIAKNYYGHGRVKEALEIIDRAISYDPEEPKLKELKEKMEKGTITYGEIMQK